MSAETPGIDSDKNRDTKTSTSKTPPATPTTTIPPFEKGGLGGIPRELGWIHHLDIWTSAETEKKSGRGRTGRNGASVYGVQKLRELILELAVRGKLVPQDPNDEPAGELIKRIQIEKAKLIAKGKIKKDKPIPPILDEEKPFELPQGWEWVRLDDIGSTFIGLTYSPKDISDNGIPVLRSSNIQNGKIDLLDLIRVSGNIKSNLFVDEGDLLICARNGSKSLVGKTAMIENLNEPMVFGAFMAIYKSPLNFYVQVFLNSPIFRSLLDGVSTTTINQITQNNLKTTLTSLPPLPEQHRIVTKVDELMALCDQLETQHSNAAEAHEKLVNHLLGTLTQSQSADDFSANWQRIAAHFDTLFTTEASIDALKQTLLQLAVMGKLVPQDPTDEPANELLERIQAEKARLMAEGKIKKGKSPLTPLLPRGETGSAAATSINPTTTTFSTPPLSNSTPNPNSTPPFEKGGPGGIQRGISEEEKSFVLPQGWMWVRLDEITSKITDGDHKTPLRILEGFRLFSAKNVRDGYLDFDNCDFISEQDYLNSRERCCPDTGDLLIVSVGGTIGRTSLVPVDSNFALVRSVALIKPLLFNSYYLKQAMDSNLLQESIHARKRGGAQPCLYLSEIEQFVFPLPPLPEQHRIVAKVDELMSLCDQLKSTITQASQLQKKLADVVVEQAIAF
ncbi:restriction endonuclease subunit S [Nitrosomonas supralitoralis]|uniref:restriction endonuclease subunit S n=1 Tax=Nitrosomonas supralitoralis TaxID=2116706 RepID=UPI0018D544C1|nr:restriction endonuclease subunit S [Nitrosomonas supralitoralis]